MTFPVGAEAAARLAAIHAEAFDAPWPEEAFADLLGQPGVRALATDDGFILISIVADEVEILTLAVRGAARRRGLARGLVDSALARAMEAGARRVFLEVAVGNVAARGLYAAKGFEGIGRRPGYYTRPDGAREDALILSRNLP